MPPPDVPGLTPDQSFNEAAEGLANGVWEGPSPFFGCPDLDETCNALTLGFEGGHDTEVRFVVYYDMGGGHGTGAGLYHDTDVANRTQAAFFAQDVTPWIPLDAVASDGELRVFWQGQRIRWQDGQIHWAEVLADHAPLDDAAPWVFGYHVRTGGESGTVSLCGHCLSDVPATARFQGRTSDRRMHAVLEEVRLESIRVRGGGPPRTVSRLAFEVASSPTGQEAAGDLVVRGAHTAMITGPDGSRSLVPRVSAGNRTLFEMDAPAAEGCHQVELVGAAAAVVIEEPGVNPEGNRHYVWDPAAEGNAGFPFSVQVSGGESQLSEGSCPSAD